MLEFRFHGRGGQGAITAAQVLAEAAFREGRYSQSFPLFGGERRGAAVQAFTRIDSQPVEIRSHVYDPDYIVVLDAGLLKFAAPFLGLKDNGIAVLNTTRSPEEIAADIPQKDAGIFCVDATDISITLYGQRAIPITNIAMLGALSSATGIVELGSITSVLDKYFTPDQVEKNIQAAKMAFERVRGKTEVTP